MKALYISQTRLDSALNAVCIRGLRENGVSLETRKIAAGGTRIFLEAVNFLRTHKEGTDCVFIGFDSPLLVTFLRPFYRGKIVYIAYRTLYEGLIVSRRLASLYSLKALYYWLFDFMAVHLADLTVAESDNQIKYFRKLFKVPGRKLFRNWIGVDENNFYYDPKINKPEVFTVLFRGALQPETGAEHLVRAAKLLEGEKIRFVMHAGGQLIGQIKSLINELNPKNIELFTGYLDASELRRLMASSHVSIGQLAIHDRLDRTIPHKAYESLVMKLPYLTAANLGVLELLRDGDTCITCKPASPKSLAAKILWVRDNYRSADKIAANGYKLYQDRLRADKLGKKLLDRIKRLN